MSARFWTRVPSTWACECSYKRVLDSEEEGKRKVHAQVSVAKPLNGPITILDGPKHDLNVGVGVIDRVAY